MGSSSGGGGNPLGFENPIQSVLMPTANTPTFAAMYTGAQAPSLSQSLMTSGPSASSATVQTPAVSGGVMTQDILNQAHPILSNPIGSSMSLAQIGAPDPNVFSAEKMGLKFAQPTDSAHASPLAAPSPTASAPLSPESVGLQSISSQDNNAGMGQVAPQSAWGKDLGKVGEALGKVGVGMQPPQGGGGHAMAPSPGGGAQPGNLAAELFAMLAKNAQQDRGFAPVGSYTK